MKLGVIGYGGRIRDVINEMMKWHPECRVVAIVDIRNEQIKAGLDQAGKGEGIAYFDTPEEMISEAKPDGILIGTRCSLHSEMALRVFPSGIPLYLEKPVAITFDQLIRLKQGFEASQCEVVVSFPLRVTSHVRKAKQIIDSGLLGTIEHVQSVNNVPYGSIYFQYWYRDEKETGGLFLQKATHEFDYLTHVLNQRPMTICAMSSKQIFKGDKPAGLQCVDCDEQRICLESAPLRTIKQQNVEGGYCCFAEDTGNEDSGSAIIRYESGMHVSYSQNFFARNKAARRGARFLGYRGTLEFDFYTNQLKVMMHHTENTETHFIDPGKDNHAGGDAVLVQNFVQVMQGKAKSIAPLEDGLLSALMCLKARESNRTNTFQEIHYPFPN